jgi:FxsC-like protein
MPGGVGDEFPQIFFSYAHAHWEDPADQREADHWVRKFYVHLNGAIRSLINAPSDKNPLFIDHALHVGDHWPDELARHLARCAVFVPLYSGKYFRHPDCGREWSVIRQRQDMHVSATNRSPNIVIPVLWQPIRLDDLPTWARSIQYTDESLGTAYNSMGLESLLRLRDYEADYHAAVRAIAQRIVEVLRRPDQLRPLHEIPRFKTLPDAFATEGSPVAENAAVRITVAALDKYATLASGRSAVWYGDTAQEWCPYRDGRDEYGGETPVAERAANVAQRRDFDAVVTALTGRSEELRSRLAPSAPTIVLVDAWATLDEYWRSLLRRLDAVVQQKPWVRIIVPWNAQDPETVTHAVTLRAGIEQALGHSLSGGRIPSRRGDPGPTNSAAFGPVVSDALRITQAEFMKIAEKHLPAGPRPQKPRLRGPSGTAQRQAGEETDEHQ